MKVYGIANCDTVKKARKWLDQEQIAFTFVDFKKNPPTESQIDQWVAAAGIDTVLNKRGTTWRKLDDQQKAIKDTQQLIALMCEHPSMIKRPIFEFNGHIVVGFSADTQAALKL